MTLLVTTITDKRASLVELQKEAHLQFLLAANQAFSAYLKNEFGPEEALDLVHNMGPLWIGSNQEVIDAAGFFSAQLNLADPLEEHKCVRGPIDPKVQNAWVELIEIMRRHQGLPEFKEDWRPNFYVVDLFVKPDCISTKHEP